MSNFCIRPRFSRSIKAFALREFGSPKIRFSRQLNPKLRGKVVEILRNYVKISVLRGVCLAFWSPFKRTWNEGSSESNGL